MTLAFITFVHPGMLAGLAAVAVPVLIHLLNRRQPRTVVFPTIRFLRAATASQSRVHRLRHLILLLLRCAFVALLAAAFARPEWFESADAAAGTDRDTVAIVLLDVSASMGYADSPVSTVNRAVTKAAAILGSLSSLRGDHANVLLVGLSPRLLYASPTSNLPALSRRLEEVRAGAERADVNAALAVAARQYADFFPSRKELHIISDMQRTNWSEADFAAMPRDVRITLHPVCPAGLRPNAGITEILCDPPRPVAGEPCSVSVRLANYGPAAVTRDVVLRSGGDEPAVIGRRLNVAIPPASPVAVSFEVRPGGPGLLELTAEIPADRLAVDDRRFAVVRVADRLRVALCTDADLNEGVTSSYLLARGLAPFPAGRETVDLRIVRGEELSVASLTGVDVVFLDSVRALTADGARALFEFVREGGGLAAFLGPGSVPDVLATLQNFSHDRDLLPFHAVEPVDSLGRSDPVGPVRIVAERPDAHPLLRPFAGNALRSLEDVSVRRYFSTRPGRKGADIAATLSPGDAAIGAVAIGSGTLLLCNISPDPQWTDLARHAIFPGLLHQFASFLRPRRWTETPCFAGMSVTRRWVMKDPLESVEIRDPRGEPVRAAIRRDGDTAVITLPRADAPGLYRVLVGGRAVESIAVNVDPQEADLRGVDESSLADRIGAAGRVMSRAAGDAGATPGTRQGVPLWHWALAAALAMLAAEMLCLVYWRR